jgi:tripartite-type tricarboxylate transporter receptor subunit TctC
MKTCTGFHGAALVAAASFVAGTSFAQPYPSKPIRLIVPFAQRRRTGSRRGGCLRGGDGARTPGLWQRVLRCTALALVVGISFVAGTSFAQPYPSKPIRLIVPFAPGGGVDFIARLLSQKLTDALGQQIVIDNRPGAGSAIGTEIALRSPADGYTLLQTSPSYAINPSLRPPRFDPLNDYTPIALIGKGPLVIVAHPSLPARNPRELIALAKARPGEIHYGTSGQGTIIHLSAELLSQRAGIRMTHVPYKGGGPALVDVMAGHVQIVPAPPQTGLPHARAGRVRAIGVTGLKRLPSEPGIPAFAETVPGYEATNWHITIGPKGMPAAVVERLSAELRKVAALPDVVATLEKSGVFPEADGNPEAVRALVRRDLEQWRKVIQQAGIKAE